MKHVGEVQSSNYLLAKFENLVDWAVNSSRANSLWPMPFGTACCAIEFMATAASRYDFARFGMERQAFSPRQADVLICAGRLPFKLAPVIRRIYDQMPQPKWVISMGACASTGGIFDNYAMVQGIDTIVPVDVYVPGCPPRPEGLLYGRSEEHTSELQSRLHLVCRLLLEKKKACVAAGEVGRAVGGVASGH